MKANNNVLNVLVYGSLFDIQCYAIQYFPRIPASLTLNNRDKLYTRIKSLAAQTFTYYYTNGFNMA